MNSGQTDLNRLKEIIIDPFNRVGSVRGHRHTKFDHEFSQPFIRTILLPIFETYSFESLEIRP
jgi:hypothetical protein